MFERFKKEEKEEEKKEEEKDNDSLIELLQEVQNDMVQYNEQLSEALEYTNSYLAQLSLNVAQLSRQLTIANALSILDSEYNNADSIMGVEEILQRKYALFGSIFVDYQVEQEKEQNND